MADQLTSVEKKTMSTKRQQRTSSIANACKEMKKTEDLLLEVPLNRKDVHTSVAKLRGYASKIVEYSEVIHALLDENALSDDITMTEKNYEALNDLIARSETALEFSKPDAEAMTPPAHNTSRRSNFSEHSHSVRLPKLEITPFNGDPMKWDEFWDSYESTIHNEDEMPSVEKFKYLKSFLTGDALRLAGGYRLTSANYDEVISALKQRYGDPEIAIFAH